MPNYPVTEEDAAEIISNAVLAQFGGMLTHVNNGCQFAQAPVCGVTKDTLITAASQNSTAPLSFKSSVQWHYSINCTDKALNATYTGNVNYSGPHFTADNTYTGTLTCTPQTTSNYKISFKLNIDGTDHKKAVDVNPLNTSIVLQSNEVVVDKTSGQVVSGQMQVSIHISYYNYSGTFKFLGNHTASLVLNSGAVYNLNL